MQNFNGIELPLNIVQSCSNFAWILFVYIGTKWGGKKIIFWNFIHKCHPSARLNTHAALLHLIADNMTTDTDDIVRDSNEAIDMAIEQGIQ